MEEKNTKLKTKVNPLVLTVLVAVLVGGAAFFGGIKYQQSRMLSIARGGNFMMGQGVRMQGTNGTARNVAFRPVSGEILNMDEKTLTVKMQDGSSKIILLSDSTTYTKSDAGKREDLKDGAQVLVIGETNTDGSVTAQDIQLNKAGR